VRSETSLAVFELADGGPLFLDEIGEVPLAMQAKLLRVVQEQELERIGDTHTRKVNVRVISNSFAQVAVLVPGSDFDRVPECAYPLALFQSSKSRG
jgi:transcriptional regulator with GAF, ATPase, and Fis domain